MLNITILGNGGCLNTGLPYNAFLLGENFLVESPPDIMLSLNQLKCDLDPIDTIFVSHLHGDHTFGLPFIIINKWIRDHENGIQSSLEHIGPRGIEGYVKKITEYAFTASNPCYNWMENQVVFREIRHNDDMALENTRLAWIRLQHVVETYGFVIEANKEVIFAYIADTKWCHQVEQTLSRKPKIVFVDMNGGDPNIHMSLNEVIEKGLPLSEDQTVYYGMHLAEEFDPAYPRIKCAKPGDKITILYE